MEHQDQFQVQDIFQAVEVVEQIHQDLAQRQEVQVEVLQDQQIVGQNQHLLQMLQQTLEAVEVVLGMEYMEMVVQV